MNKHKRNAKIATSLNEVVAQTKLSGNEFSVKIIARGADGKKGTGDDKIRRKSKTKVKGDSMGEVKTPKGGWQSAERKYQMLKLTSQALKLMPGSPAQKKVIKQLNVVRKEEGLKPLKEQGSEWEEMFGDSTYQDSYWAILQPSEAR